MNAGFGEPLADIVREAFTVGRIVEQDRDLLAILCDEIFRGDRALLIVTAGRAEDQIKPAFGDLVDCRRRRNFENGMIGDLRTPRA